jgi:hypothetical protein
MFIPNDPASVSLFVTSEMISIEEVTLTNLARLAHENYLTKRIADDKDKSLKVWDELPDNLKQSNMQQVRCAVFNLEKAGFIIEPVKNEDSKEITFSDEEVELLSELEHGRWNAERLLDGWRYGKVKNTEKKINPSLVPYAELPNWIKEYDRIAVRSFPELLAKNGMQISRKENNAEIFAKTKALLSSKFHFTSKI